MGKEGQTVPAMGQEWIADISNRYIELYEKVIGKKFVPETYTTEELYSRIVAALEKL